MRLPDGHLVRLSETRTLLYITWRGISFKKHFKQAKNHLKLQMLLKSEKVRVQQKTQSHSFFLPFLLLTSEYRSINIKILKTDEIISNNLLPCMIQISIVKDFLR